MKRIFGRVGHEKSKRTDWLCLLLVIVAPLMVSLSCLSEPESEMVRKLHRLCRSDLTVIVDGIDTAGLLETPKYVVVSLKTYDEGVFRALAVVDFFFLRSIDKKITRKYRYWRQERRWDRFFNEYRTYEQNDFITLSR